MKDIISRFENSNELGDLQMLLSWLQKWAIQERDHCSNTISDKDKLIKMISYVVLYIQKSV
jgi:hypothetical protein